MFRVNCYLEQIVFSVNITPLVHRLGEDVDIGKIGKLKKNKRQNG